MRDNLVSVIMPCFNSEHFIENAIKSVLNQTYQLWELIICDDDSDDNSKKLIKEYVKKDSRIKLTENKYSKGASGARNSCLNIAEGQFIAFLDSDDLWHREKLTQQINFMTSNNYFFCFSYFDVINKEGMYLHSWHCPKIANKKNMLLSNFIPCLTAIYDAKRLGKIYQPDIKKRNDYALWLKILNSGQSINAYCLEIVTASYRNSKYGLSSGSKFDLLKYYWKCLIDFGSVSKLSAIFLTFPYLSILFIKKSSPFIYNKLVIRL